MTCSVRCGRRVITLGLELDVERRTVPSDCEPWSELLAEDFVEDLRITDPEDEEPVDEPDPPRGAAGITPVARGAGKGLGVCTLDVLRVTLISDPGAGALAELPVDPLTVPLATGSLLVAERITGSDAVLEVTGLELIGLEVIGLEEVAAGAAVPPTCTLRPCDWLGRLVGAARKER